MNWYFIQFHPISNHQANWILVLLLRRSKTSLLYKCNTIIYQIGWLTEKNVKNLVKNLTVHLTFNSTILICIRYILYTLCTNL